MKKIFYPDTQLISDLQSGKELALKEYMRRHARALRYFAYSIIQDKEAAEEIVNDCFVKLWANRTRFADSEKVKAFLYIATRNACLNYASAIKNNIAFLREGAEEQLYSTTDISAEIIRAQLLELVYAEVDKLPRQEATIFRLAYLEGLSTDEICEQLSISPSNVYFYRSKSLKTLQLIFKEKNLVAFLAFFQLLTHIKI